MGKSVYIGIDGKARKVKNIYTGIDGKARKVKKAWIGVDGKARLFYSSGAISKLPTFTGGNSKLTGDEEKGSIECYGSGTLSLGDGTYDVFAVGGGGGGGGEGGGGGGGGYTTTSKSIEVVSGDYGVFIGAGGVGGATDTLANTSYLTNTGGGGGSTSIVFDQKLSGSLPSSADSVIVMNNGIKDKLNYALPTVTGSHSYITTGKSGGGIKLSGGYIQTNKQYDLNHCFTVCGWFRRTGKLESYWDDSNEVQVNAHMGLFNQAFREYDGGGEDDAGYDYYVGLRLWLSKTGNSTSECRLNVELSANENAQYSAYATNAEALFPLNTWVHVAVVKQDNYVKVYVNGVQKISKSLKSGIKIPLVKQMVIGDNRTGLSDNIHNPFYGDVDEVIISEDTAFWTAAFTPPVLSYDNNQFTTITTVRAAGGKGGYAYKGGAGGSGGGGNGYDTSDDSSHTAGGNGGTNGGSGSSAGGGNSGGSGQNLTTRAFYESSGYAYGGGGGGAGGGTSYAGGTGGAYGGGTGGGSTTSTAGTANSGGGGGGSKRTSSSVGSAGGSGLIIVRWGYENNLVPLETLTTGTTVKFKKLDGSYMNFVIVQKGLPSSIYDSSCNGTWLLLKSYYAPGATAGNANYVNSSYNKTQRFNFEALLDEKMRNKISTVKIPYVNGLYASGTVQTGANGLSTKSFLLSAKEIGSTVSGLLGDGACLEYFNDSSTNTSRNNIGYAHVTRSPASTAGYVVSVSSAGAHTTVKTSTTTRFRPAIILPNNTFLVDKAQNSNVLVLE